MKPGGTLGMVAPLSIANARMARELRRFLNKFEITAVVSLEWLRLRKEIFKGVDIAPMLIFGRRVNAATSHRIRSYQGSKSVWTRAIHFRPNICGPSFLGYRLSEVVFLKPHGRLAGRNYCN